MFLKKAQLFQFRNYKSLSLSFSYWMNIFIGDNGQGKSSFLEALYCALKGKSFHSFVGSHFIQKNKKKAKVCLTLKETKGESKIEASFFSDKGRLKKELLYCGKKVTASFLWNKFPCFIFTEESLKCIRQGPRERRIFIENLFSHSQHKVKLSFEKLLLQKKTLLKDYKKGRINKSDLAPYMLALNTKILREAYALTKARLNTLNRLYSSLEQIKKSFFKDSLTKLDFDYFSEEGKSLKKERDIFSILKKNLEQKKNQELLAGIPLFGPQRHEIKLLFNGEDSRTFCSKGQQRSYVLSLFLSHLQSFPQALLFLDDVLLELDEKSQEKFLKFLEKRDCQIFLTNCKIMPSKTDKMEFFKVKEAQIEKINGIR